MESSHPFDVYMASFRLEAIVKALIDADSTKKTRMHVIQVLKSLAQHTEKNMCKTSLITLTLLTLNPWLSLAVLSKQTRFAVNGRRVS